MFTIKKFFSLITCILFCLLIIGCNNKPTHVINQNKSEVNIKLLVASYNVQCLSYGSQLNEIANEIKELNPDIIGLQELDSFTNRTGNLDQIKLLAQAAGYDYYYFTKTISYDGGEYGHGIMSKYPINNYEAIAFDNQDSETRCYSRSVIDVEGKEIVFYNTHLEFMGDYQTKQMAELVEKTKTDEYFVITGDMNCGPKRLQSVIDNDRMIMLNGGETYKKPIATCPEGENSHEPIDNIIVSRSFKYHFDKQNDTGILVNKTENSDHNMIYTYLEF